MTILAKAVALIACAAIACENDDLLSVHEKQVADIGTCRLKLDGVYSNDGQRFAGIQSVCDAKSGPNWWGSGPEPLAFSLETGDCLLLKDAYYCVSELSVASHMTIERTYQATTDREVLKREPR